MSTAYSSAKQQYIGNGVTTEWGFDFPIKKHSELKVYLKRSTSPQVLLEEGVDYSFVTDNTITFPIKTVEAKLQATDVLALQRESVFESEYNFSNQQRLEPEEVMHADDNLERQIQELKRDVSQAIRIQPTSNIDTDEYFVAVESIYENLDNITNVSGISSEIVNCSDNISDISTVSSNIANVNTVGQSISNVNTVAGNISSVNTVAGVSTDVTTVAGVASSVPTVANNSANVNTAATNIAAIQDAPNQAASAQNSANTAQTMATQAAQSAQTAEDKADEASESARLAVSALSLQIGDIGFAPLGIDESLNLRRYLNGQVISQSQFVSFTNKVKSAIALYPNLAATETNWQAEKTNSKLGQCGKFVVDDTAGTIRLPCVVNAQGLVDLALIGGIKSESLPNITGEFGGSYYVKPGSGTDATGAFENTKKVTSSRSGGENPTGSTYNFNASRSSSTYQDNAPVQQEAIQYPYYIQVATGVEETLPAIREYKTNIPYVLGDSKYSEANPYNASWLVSNGQYNAKATYPDMWTQLQVELNSSLNKGDTVVIDGKTYVKRGLPVVLSTDTYTDYDWVVNTSDETFRLPLLNGDRVLVKKYKNGATWYNLYSDGWLEQGSFSAVNIAGNPTQINFVVPFIDANITLLTQQYTYIGGTAHANNGVYNVTNSGFVFYCGLQAGTSPAIYWKANGYAPIPTQVDFTEVTGLYFYVGDTVQDASLINAGAVLGQLANKTNSVEAAAASMPSSRYIDLTLGASGSTYTAPANGYVVLRKATTQVSQFIEYDSDGIYINSWTPYATANLAFCQAIKKGSVFKIGYNAGGSTLIFRFIYAEGEN